MSIDLVVNYSIVANPRYYKCEVISYYLVLPFSLHQVCGLFRRGAAVDLVHESPAKPCSFVSLAPSLRPFSARGRGGLGARILARPCSSVHFAPSLRAVSACGRGGLGARIPARPCSSVPFAPSLRGVSRRGRRGLGARIPARPCSSVRFAPSLRVVSRRGRRQTCFEPPLV